MPSPPSEIRLAFTTFMPTPVAVTKPLDEFVFRFNRRRTRHATFDALLAIAARTTPAPYHVLIRKAA
jgi:hypothetical protein